MIYLYTMFFVRLTTYKIGLSDAPSVPYPLHLRYVQHSHYGLTSGLAPHSPLKTLAYTWGSCLDRNRIYELYQQDFTTSSLSRSVGSIPTKWTPLAICTFPRVQFLTATHSMLDRWLLTIRYGTSTRLLLHSHLPPSASQSRELSVSIQKWSMTVCRCC